MIDGKHMQRRERWAKTRAKGFWRFVLFNGVVVWGGVMTLFLGVLMPYLNHTSRSLPLAAAVCLSGGLLWGVLTWLLSERMYSRNQPSREIP